MPSWCWLTVAAAAAIAAGGAVPAACTAACVSPSPPADASEAVPTGGAR